MKKILFVVNSSEFFLSHRLPIAVAALDEGYEVHVASPSGSGAKKIKSKDTVLGNGVSEEGDNGVDGVNKKVMDVLTKTGKDNVCRVKRKKGLVYKKDGKW